MALQKDITNELGIVLNYHRITSLQIITNVENIIEVTSYLDRDYRDNEKSAYILAKRTGDFPSDFSVYTNTHYISLDYDPNMSIEDAYEYLKTLDSFSAALDG